MEMRVVPDWLGLVGTAKVGQNSGLFRFVPGLVSLD